MRLTPTVALSNQLHAVTWQSLSALRPKLHLHRNKNTQPQYMALL